MSTGDMPNLHVINGTKGFMVVSNGSLRFLDVKNYLAPETSSIFFKSIAYKIAERFISV